MTSPIAALPELVRSLYKLVGKLETLAPGRKFTLDGHLVGSIGEVLAADRYGLDLLPASTKTHDARSKEGRMVQIKATQRNAVALRDEPEHLIVLKLLPDGTTEEIYNGPGALAWKNVGKLQSNGQRSIGVKKLDGLMKGVSQSEQLQLRAR